LELTLSERETIWIEIRVGESLSFDGGRVMLTLKEKSGQRARLHISAEKGVTVDPVRMVKQA